MKYYYEDLIGQEYEISKKEFYLRKFLHYFVVGGILLALIGVLISK